MKLQQRRIGEETARGPSGETKYKTIDISIDDIANKEGRKSKDVKALKSEDAIEVGVSQPDSSRGI